MINQDKNVKCVSICIDDWLLYGTLWNYNDYVELLNALLKEHKVILGGDILSYDETDKLEYTGSGWSCDSDSFLDSNIVAQKYLAGLANWAATENLFISLVLKKYNQSN